jgi:periplasmic mercuric ion binding protein
MKIKIILVSLVALVLSACDQTKSSKQVLTVKQTQVQKSVVKSNTKITFEVEGMVCKMGCGGSIRKNLLQAGGVERVQVDFVEEAKSQEITVHYDSTLTDVVQLKKRIEQTNDGQFTVLSNDKTRKSN